MKSNNTSNGNATKPPDCRVKITNEVKSTVLDQISGGKTQQRVADNLKLSQKSVSNICKADEKKQAAAQQRTAKAREIKKALKDDQSVVVGDFRPLAGRLTSETLEPPAARLGVFRVGLKVRRPFSVVLRTILPRELIFTAVG